MGRICLCRSCKRYVDVNFYDMRSMYCKECWEEYNLKNENGKEIKEDIINKPNHYHQGGVDVVTFCNGKVSDEQMKGFYRVNVIKYVGRYELKNGIEDLNKAKWNLEKLIELEEGK